MSKYYIYIRSLTDLTLNKSFYVFIIIASCLLILSDTLNFFGGALSKISTTSYTNPLLPTLIEHYLNKTLRYIIPSLCTFQNNSVLKSILVWILTLYHVLYSIDNLVVQFLPIQNVFSIFCSQMLGLYPNIAVLCLPM